MKSKQRFGSLVSFWRRNQIADLSLFAGNGELAKRGSPPPNRSWRADRLPFSLSKGGLPSALTKHTASGGIESRPFTALIPKPPHHRTSSSFGTPQDTSGSNWNHARRDMAVAVCRKPLECERIRLRLGTGFVLDEVMALGYPPIPGYFNVLSALRARVAGDLSEYLRSTTGDIAASEKPYLTKIIDLGLA